jgi:hypothetical protein
VEERQEVFQVSSRFSSLTLLQLTIRRWVRTALVAEKLIVDLRQPKHNLTDRDVSRILTAVLTKDDASYIHERDRIQFNMLVILYMSMGAWYAAFFTRGV